MPRWADWPHIDPYEDRLRKVTITALEAQGTLLDPSGRVPPGDFTTLQGLTQPGLYAWFVDQTGATDIAAGVGVPMRSGLIYAGQAGAGTSSATVGSRVRGNHLRGNIHGSTFRLTLASALRARLALEPAGDRQMTPDGESRLSSWMNDHLRVAAIPYPNRKGLDAFETAVLELLDPPLNLAKRPSTPIRRRLTDLRRPFATRTPARASARPAPSYRSHPTSAPQGPTPEELARELGLPSAKSVRGFLRENFPRPEEELWSRWGSLEPNVEAAVRARFGNRR